MVTTAWEAIAGVGSGAGSEIAGLGRDGAFVAGAASETTVADVICGTAAAGVTCVAVAGTVSGDGVEAPTSGACMAAGVRA